ncbi:hypothetical protein MFRU_015g00240 [Monilinia fructicola]|uniref:2EXR domain-containing protein n=1 Tax=Monilinia fructicola TaxID=38448 RepID=A0A5M9K6Z4_MONFR|nr:hypothetical protein EYC84_006027 [Monilinia fructicola]KAG4029480.1 hypothetical protein MFRU_015g00240 [Monilinia fructicola]
MSSFPQFTLLPTELQLHIWNFALEVQEGHIVPIENLRYGRPRKFVPHALYFVNCDARRIYLGYHKKNLARYSRMGTVVFDPRIDIVFMEVGWVHHVELLFAQIRDSVESRIMKDVRNIAIGGFFEMKANHEGRRPRIFPTSMGNTIARVLPSLETFTYVLGFDSRYSKHRSRYRESYGVINSDQILSSLLQKNMIMGRENSYETIVERTREVLQEYKRSENSKFNVPMIQAKFAIHGQVVPYDRGF